MDARLSNIMRVIDHYAMAAAGAAENDVRALLAGGDTEKRDGHRAAARASAEEAATIRIEVEQIVAGLLYGPAPRDREEL